MSSRCCPPQRPASSSLHVLPPGRAACGASSARVSASVLAVRASFAGQLALHSSLPSHHIQIQDNIKMGTPYKPLEAIQLLRPTFRTARLPPQARLFSISRASPATHKSTTSSSPPPPPPPSRRSVTVTNDTGSVKWSDLSVGEKAARTTQQTFNFGIIIAGIVLTVSANRPTQYHTYVDN